VIRKESDGEIVCKGNTVQVFVHKDTMELSLTVPDFIDDWKKEVGLL
jgi:acyl-CoA thioester hydrolase